MRQTRKARKVSRSLEYRGKSDSAIRKNPEQKKAPTRIESQELNVVLDKSQSETTGNLQPLQVRTHPDRIFKVDGK